MLLPDVTTSPTWKVGLAVVVNLVPVVVGAVIVPKALAPVIPWDAVPKAFVFERSAMVLKDGLWGRAS